MKKLLVLAVLLIFAVGCWQSAKETLAENYAKVTTPGFSKAAGCEFPNTVVEPYLFTQYKKLLKVNKKMKAEADRFEAMEENAQKAGLDSTEQKGFIRAVCKAAVKWLAPVLASRGEDFPTQLKNIKCSKQQLLQSGGDFICGFAPLTLTR